jgi:hypothetical protein
VLFEARALVWRLLERREQERELHVHAERHRDGHCQRAVTAGSLPSAASLPWAGSIERRVAMSRSPA